MSGKKYETHVKGYH